MLIFVSGTPRSITRPGPPHLLQATENCLKRIIRYHPVGTPKPQRPSRRLSGGERTARSYPEGLCANRRRGARRGSCLS